MVDDLAGVLDTITPREICDKITDHKDTFEPNPLFYIVHHPLKKD